MDGLDKFFENLAIETDSSNDESENSEFSEYSEDEIEIVSDMEQEDQNILEEVANLLGMISFKKSLILIFGHKHKILNLIKKFENFHKEFKNFHKKFGIFHKKFQQPSFLVYILNKIANFYSKLH